jgi:hypothetical protein
LNNLSVDLGGLGRPEHGLATIDETDEIDQRLAVRCPMFTNHIWKDRMRFGNAADPPERRIGTSGTIAAEHFLSEMNALSSA